MSLLSVALLLISCDDSSTSSTTAQDQGSTWLGEDSTVPWNAEVPYGTIEHGGRSYRTVDIGTQRWMAENLSIATPNSWVYGNRPENERLHGRLYSWATAMGLPAACDHSVCEDRIRSLQGICPDGWHIPTSEDWSVLSERLSYTVDDELLRAKAGWINGPGLDFFGFRALPSGRIVESGTISTEIGENAYWWSSSEDLSSYAYNNHIDYDDPGLSEGQYRKLYGHSVRCLADAPIQESPVIDSIVLVADSIHQVIDGAYLAYRAWDSLPGTLSTISLRAYSGLALQPMECNGRSCSGIQLDGMMTDVAVRIGGGGSASRRYLRILRSAETWRVTRIHVDGQEIPLVAPGQIGFMVEIESPHQPHASIRLDIAGAGNPTVWCNGTSCDSVPLSGAETLVKVVVEGPSRREIRMLTLRTDSMVSTNENIVYGTVSIGGKAIRTISAGGRHWMAENHPGGAGLDTGRLVFARTGVGTWNERAFSPEEASRICPSGWHLPSLEEWYQLVKATRGEDSAGYDLKSRFGWESETDVSANGSDALGFGALPVGWLVEFDTLLHIGRGTQTLFWTSTPSDSGRMAVGITSARVGVTALAPEGILANIAPGSSPRASVRCIDDHP